MPCRPPIGAACSSGSPEPSPVLLALGLTPGAALEAVRFSLGTTNTEQEVDQVAQWVEEIILQVRALSAPAGLSGKAPAGVSL